MHEGQSDYGVHLGPTANVSRRTALSLAAKFIGGAALSLIAGARLAHVAAAQDDEIILTAAASEIGARPGSAYARSAAASIKADQTAGVEIEIGLFEENVGSRGGPH